MLVLKILLIIFALNSSLYAENKYLKWTATGDDFNSGQASQYDMRFSRDSLSLKNNWDTSSKLTSIVGVMPSLPGSIDSVLIPDSLKMGIWFFAIKIGDEANNWSTISNIAIIGIDSIKTATWISN